MFVPPPRLSVVIPAFNAADTLERAVNSVLASAEAARREPQLKELKLEIAVVDDGSTDSTASCISHIHTALEPKAGVKFIPVLGGPNQGASVARNRGVVATTAPLLAFLDADDEYLPDHISTCLTALLNDREIGFVWTKRVLDVDIHPSWGPSLDRSTVMNLCVRRIWHEIMKGFPEHPDFRTHHAEDSFYRIALEKLVQGRHLDVTTVHIHANPGNSLDRQRVKLNTPIHLWDSSQESYQPTPGIIAELEERLAYIDTIKAEMAG